MPAESRTSDARSVHHSAFLGSHVPASLTFVTSDLSIGGAERHWAILIPSLRDRGYRVRVLTLVGEGPFFDELREKSIEVACARMRRRSDVAGIRRAFRFIEDDTDLLVSQNVNAQVIAGLAVRKRRRPHVMIDHAGPGIALRRYQRLLVRASAPTTDLLIGVSSAQIERFVGLGFDRDRITVIPNGVDDLSPTRDRDTVRSELGAGREDFLAMLVADLRPEKQAEVFVESVARAHAVDRRVKGAVVGAGFYTARVTAAAERTGGAVLMTGPRLDIADLMNAADVVCLSSVSEGLPMVLLEAMSLSKAIVATDVAGVRDAVIQAETGLLVPVGDRDAFAAALLDLAHDPQLLERLGRRGHERQQREFTASRMADAYAEAFERVLSG
jgi:glycosyltransferase involved in cell wall biosynthesis